MECIFESHKLWNRLIVTAFTIQSSLYTAKLLNWMFDNLKIPIIWRLGIVPLGILLFTQKLHHWNRDMFKKSSLYINCYGISCLVLCPLLQLWRLKKTHKTLMTLNLMKEIPKCNTLWLAVQPKYRQCSYHLFMTVVTHNTIRLQVSAYSKPSSGLTSTRTIKAWCSVAVKVFIDSSW
jgi:hypothetical protein